MEKAKTASSTSHSSETRWRGTMHFRQSSPGLRSVTDCRSLCPWQWQRQWRMALVFSSRWNTGIMGAGPGGAAGCCMPDVDRGDNNACHTQAMIRGEVGTWPAPGP